MSTRKTRRDAYADRPKFLEWFDELRSKCNDAELDDLIDEAFDIYDDGHDIDYALAYFNFED